MCSSCFIQEILYRTIWHSCVCIPSDNCSLLLYTRDYVLFSKFGSTNTKVPAQMTIFSFLLSSSFFFFFFFFSISHERFLLIVYLNYLDQPSCIHSIYDAPTLLILFLNKEKCNCFHQFIILFLTVAVYGNSSFLSFEQHGKIRDLFIFK
jgi:hypothetical protein